MDFPPITFETAAVILLLLSGILFLLVGILYCVYKFYIKFSLARLRITELQERMRNERIQEYLSTTGKEVAKMAETLSPAMCKMAKASVPAECLTEMTRSALGRQTNQGGHFLSKLILEASKTLSASLKPKG